MSTIKPIETHYAGCRFRSRLEARWAVFFTTAGIPWEYEPQGFVIDDMPYLPDFRLPQCGTWIEVKGVLTERDSRLLRAASDQLPVEPNGGEAGPPLLLLGSIPQLPRPNYWGEIPDLVWTPDFGFGSYHKQRRPWWVEVVGQRIDPLVPVVAETETMRPAIAAAYLAARSARFEHGENGRSQPAVVAPSQTIRIGDTVQDPVTDEFGTVGGVGSREIDVLWDGQWTHARCARSAVRLIGVESEEDLLRRKLGAIRVDEYRDWVNSTRPETA